jgi:hypothetical protein
MAYEFLLPILTPDAQAVVRTQPEVVTTLLVVLVVLIVFGVFCWWIGYAVRKPAVKRPAPAGKKGGPAAKK